MHSRGYTLVDEDHLAGALAAHQLVEDAAAFGPAGSAGREDFGVADRGDRSGAGEVDPLVDAPFGRGEEGTDVFDFEAGPVADVDVVVVVGQREAGFSGQVLERDHLMRVHRPLQAATRS